MGKKLNQKLNIAEPIKSVQDLNAVKKWLRDYNIMYYTIFVIGINSGLRISDILKLKINGVENADFVEIIEQKTGKRKKFPLTNESKKAIKEYLPIRAGKFALAGYENYLFVGKKGKKLDRSNVARTFKRVSKELGLSIHFSTHTMRKTFGYHLYKQTKDLALIQKILNHSSQRITQRYIGIEQEEIDYAYKNLKFGSRIKKAETKKIDDNIAGILKIINNRIEDLQSNLTSKFEYLKKRVELPKNSDKELKTRRFLIDYINNGGMKYRDFAEMALRGC